MRGLLDWFNAPVLGDTGADAGYTNLGLIGATLKDVGASLSGKSGSSLEEFAKGAQHYGRPQYFKSGDEVWEIQRNKPPRKLVGGVRAPVEISDRHEPLTIEEASARWGQNLAMRT